MTAGGRFEEPGTVGEEFARLVESAQGWVRATLGDHVATGEECRYCPVCRVLAVLRGDRSDVADRFSELAGTLVEAVRAWLDQAAASTGAHAPHPHPPAARPDDHPGSDGAVERIDIS